MSNNKIRDAFRITAFLDAARWESVGNYNLINFCSDSLSDDEKILTHWLCYVTDRQMPFDRIWSIGGFVFSELVHEMKTRSDFDLLNPSKPDKSFFIRAQDYQDKDRYGFKDKRLDGFLFVSHKEVGSNTRLQEYEFKNDTRPYFIPRYYPSDYFSLLSTFVVLQEYDNSLATFVISILNRNMGDPMLVPKLVFALYLLTYHDIHVDHENAH